MVGHPDWQSIPRSFLASVVESGADTLTPGQLITYTVTASEIAEVLVTALSLNPDLSVRIVVYSSGSLVTEETRGYALEVQTNLWIPVHGRGGQVDVMVTNHSGAVNRTVQRRLISYIGVTSAELVVPSVGSHKTIAGLGAGVQNIDLTLQNAPAYDRVVIVASGTQPFDLQAKHGGQGISWVQTVAAVAANTPTVVEIPLPAVALRIGVTNTGAAAGTFSYGYRAYRVR